MLIFFGLLDFPHFTIANIDDSIFAVGNFLDAIRFAKAVTASTHARFALSRLDIHASHLLPIVVFALVVVARHAVHSRTSVLVHAIALSSHTIVIRDMLASSTHFFSATNRFMELFVATGCCPATIRAKFVRRLPLAIDTL